MKRRSLIIDLLPADRYHFERPAFSSLQLGMPLGKNAERVEFFFDFNKRDHLVGIWYLFDSQSPSLVELLPYFSAWSKYCEGISAHALMSLDLRNLFRSIKADLHSIHIEALSQMLRLVLRKATYQYLGIIDEPFVLAKSCAHDLLCRCQGVYTHQCVQWQLKNPSASLNEVAQGTGASQTCNSCYNALEDIYQKTKDRYALFAQHDRSSRFNQNFQWPRFKGLTPIEFLQLLDEHLSLWQTRESLPTHVELNIVDLSGYKVFVSVQGTQRPQDYLSALNQYWVEALGVRVEVALAI